jgi:hypothetical protein
MKKSKLLRRFFLFIFVVLFAAQAAPAQDLPPVQPDKAIPALQGKLSADGRTLLQGVPTLLLLADPNPPNGYWADEASSSDPPTSSFSVTYLAAGQKDLWGQTCQDFPETAKTAFQTATAIWSHRIQSSVPITVTACWANIGSLNILGYSGGGTLLRDFTGAPKASTWYAKPLANALAGSELEPTSQDMHITYNSGIAWYFGTDTNTPSAQYDLVTAAAQQIAHGLNFAGSAAYSGGTGSYGYGTGYPNVYDTFIRSGGGTPLTSYATPSTDLGALLTSSDLWFDGANVDAVNQGAAKLYAPSPWGAGSSYAHLDYDTFASSPNSMMVYALGAG